jgi:glucosamine--fructose-6-phosphate aminotransferase (isomerizing)
MTPATRMRSEIGEQPAAVANTLEGLRGPAEALSAALRARSVDRVVLVARGSSDHAAVYGRYLLEGRCGLVTALAAPSLYTTYAAPVDLRGALAIGVSQSGETPEIVSALSYARSRGALTAGITNDAGSSLARSVEHPLVTCAGDERSVAATKTFTAQLAAFAALAAALGASELRTGLAVVPRLMEQTIELSEDAAARAAATLAADDAAVCVARGFSYAVALEAALKLKETCAIWAEGFSSADLRHGPTAAVTSATPALVFHAGGALEDDVEQLERELRARGAALISVGPGRELPTAGAPCEELAPFTLVIPAQLLAERLARLRGRDPDRPLGLLKITETH